MSRISEFATGRRVLYGLGTLIVGGGLLFGLGPFPRVQAAAPGGLLPEQQLGYGPGQLLDFLDAIEAEGRTAYLQFQRLDILTPLRVSCFGDRVAAQTCRHDIRSMDMASVRPGARPCRGSG